MGIDKIIKYTQTEGEILIEAFMIINNKESGLEGFMGFAEKSLLKKTVEKLIAIIKGNSF